MNPKILGFFLLLYALPFAAQNNCDSFKIQLAKDIRTVLSDTGNQVLLDFTNLIQQRPDCIPAYEIPTLYTQAIEIANCKNDLWLLSRLSYNRILHGYTHVESLVDTIAFKIEDAYPAYFKAMERAMDSVFLVRMQNNHHFHVNFELAFSIRSMLKRDERSKFKTIQARKLGLPSDSLFRESALIDSLNEILLGDIFDQYGYPSFDLVGSSANDAYLILFHLSTDFQVKYIRLLANAIESRQIYTDPRFLIDKILYKSGKNILYNTDWVKFCPVENDPAKRNELLHFLGLKPEI
jgi:hypothetical protein